MTQPNKELVMELLACQSSKELDLNHTFLNLTDVILSAKRAQDCKVLDNNGVLAALLCHSTQLRQLVPATALHSFDGIFVPLREALKKATAKNASTVLSIRSIEREPTPF